MALDMDPDGTVILNGPQGITGTPKDSTFLIGFILIMVTLFIVLNLINSRDGRAIMAIRDNVIAAESIGINVTKYKLMAFTISAAMAGLSKHVPVKVSARGIGRGLHDRLVYSRVWHLHPCDDLCGKAVPIDLPSRLFLVA